MYCETKHFNIGKFFVEKNAINLSPEYQRQAGAWGREKQQLFLHSLFASYDVPKIYMHKLPTNGGLHEYALVDGKQRLQCIWDFMDNKIELGAGSGESVDFISGTNAQKQNAPLPSKGDRYSDLSVYWQEQFRSISLDVVVIHDADDQDIEALFSRLNNGEPLNAAELRNAMGGTMCRLIREVAGHKFFEEVVPTQNKRYQHYDIAARFLLIEETIIEGHNHKGYCTLKKRFLDDLVKKNVSMGGDKTKSRHEAVKKQLNTLCQVFSSKPELLKRAGYLQLYYLFVKDMQRLYAHERMISLISEFLESFTVQRYEALGLDPEQRVEERHRYLEEFERLMQQGNDKVSLEERVSIMTRFFLGENPDMGLRDPKRLFTNAERYVIYVRGGKKCADCEKSLEFSEFQADHVAQWAHSGKTSLENAQVLCEVCNAKKNKKVA